MAITEAFKNYVAENNIMTVRVVMKNSLLMDHTFKDFNDMESYSKNMPNLYDQHNNTAIEQDESLWNDDYLDKQCVQLIDNFSHERIKHIKSVISKLYPNKKSTHSPDRKDIKITSYESEYERKKKIDASNGNCRTYAEQKSIDEKKGIRLEMVAGCTLAGGVAGGILASSVESIPIGVGVGLGLVLGCASYLAYTVVKGE